METSHCTKPNPLLLAINSHGIQVRYKQEQQQQQQHDHDHDHDDDQEQDRHQHQVQAHLPPQLQSYRFTAREKLLIAIAMRPVMSPTHVQTLQHMVADLDAQPFEQQTANALLARHGHKSTIRQGKGGGDDDDETLSSWANYGVRFSHPNKQINLFENVLKMPLVAETLRLSMDGLCQALKESSRATIMDIGLGKGAFVIKVLQQLASTNSHLQQLHVIAIDIDPESLAIVRQNISSLQASIHHLQISCITILSYAEDIDWTYINTQVTGDLVVVSNFTLHHLKTDHPQMQVGARLARDRFFQGLATLQPVLVNIVEPDSNHIPDQLHIRLPFLLLHFRAVKEYIDHIDFADPQHTNQDIRNALVQQFFGNEVHDIVAGTDTARTERHETYFAWQKRFLDHGFYPQQLQPSYTSKDQTWHIRAIPGVARFYSSGFPILALLSFSARNPTMDVPTHVNNFQPEHKSDILAGADIIAWKGSLIQHLHSNEAIPFSTIIGVHNIHVTTASSSMLSLVSRLLSSHLDVVMTHNVIQTKWEALQVTLNLLQQQNKSIAVCFSNTPTESGISNGMAYTDNKMSIENLIKTFPKVLWVVDEERIHDSQQAECTMLEAALNYNNVVLLRSAPQESHLASSNVVYAIAHPYWIEKIRALEIPSP